MKNKILILLTILLFNYSWAQIPYLSKEAKVSVLTCGPGDELYSKFGHSAIRIKDPVNRMDLIYNYGVFDFTQPNFYLNFAKGRLDYMLVRHRSNDFINQYRSEGRSVVEQELNLNTQQQNKLLQFLENNAKPENRTYSYHFFFNNCATKIIDVIELTSDDTVFEEEFISHNKSFRDLINDRLDKNSWGALGINIALGSKIDHIATDYQHRFLPENIQLQLKNSSIGTKPLVASQRELISQTNTNKSSFSIVSPLAIFSLILLLSLVLIVKSTSIKLWTTVLFTIASVVGIGILFLWFFTNHDMTQNNFNVLWANPLLLILIFAKKIKPTILKTIHLISILGILIIPIVALCGLQSFNYTLYPLITTLLLLLLKSYRNTSRA